MTFGRGPTVPLPREPKGRLLAPGAETEGFETVRGEKDYKDLPPFILPIQIITGHLEALVSPL